MTMTKPGLRYDKLNYLHQNTSPSRRENWLDVSLPLQFSLTSSFW